MNNKALSTIILVVGIVLISVGVTMLILGIVQPGGVFNDIYDNGINAYDYSPGNVTNVYAIYFDFDIDMSNNWTEREKRIYMLGTLFRENDFPVNAKFFDLDESKTYNNIFEFPLEDDCFESKYNESCFVKYKNDPFVEESD